MQQFWNTILSALCAALMTVCRSSALKLMHLKKNFFRRACCCLRERVDVKLRLYFDPAVCPIIDIEQFESCGSAVAEEAGEVCVCVWNAVEPNSVEVRQPEPGSNASSYQRFLLCVDETDFKEEAGDVINLEKVKIRANKDHKIVFIILLINLLEWAKYNN